MPEVSPTPLPAPVDALHLLALLTRVRRARVDAGALKPSRLHDVRAFKCCFAELGYLRRLAAAGRHGGTAVTSMRQLVTGLSAMHPAWDMSGGPFEARDRHQQAVRRRLRDLSSMGLLRCSVGLDYEGEERRTEIVLLDPPRVGVDELKEAAVVLARWQARYGSALNTGSRTGVRNAAAHGRPLTAEERKRRACHRARAQAARRRVRGSQSNSAPPAGASASPRRKASGNPQRSNDPNASQRTSVTRTRAHSDPSRSTALERTPSPGTAGSEEGVRSDGREPSSPNVAAALSGARGGAVWDPEALVARVAARQAARAPVVAAIARQAQARALEVAEWSLDRAWPTARLREAWVVARWGATVAADSGAGSAGPLEPELYVRLRRAVARYERNATAAPEGYPAGGLAALLHIGVLSATGEIPGGPRLLGYAVGRLDLLSKRMRAQATAESAQRSAGAAARARRRRDRHHDGPIRFRIAGWPAWVLLEGRSEPAFDAYGHLLLNPALADAGRAPAPNTEAFRLIVRDAYLLAGRPLPAELDGRQTMALRARGSLPPAQRPQPQSLIDLELRELAHRTGQPVARLRHLSPTFRARWLHEHRLADAERARAEASATREALAALHDRGDRS